MSTLRTILAATALTMAATAASAATKNGTGCPAGAWTDYSAPGGVSISWSFSGATIPAVVAFQPTRMVMGGGVAPLTPTQVANWSPTLDNLRAAAQAQRQVSVFWDDVTKTVSTVIVRWQQPC
ncbi:MAG: hypothetical protein K2Q06_09780 [Parvularculaceae bacterium]|nr:hypothetical protein [Parvularculaceae bacterium]